jgi:alkanesulfonate monooxygenase SsuD/methylene tetrahydromethanopterin reductase-like flavin-dependent oxidoreductase (luciferase family)
MNIHLGLVLPPTGIPDTARAAESAGLDGVWAGDHLVTGSPWTDSAVALAAAATSTTRIAVGWSVLLPALRPLAWAFKAVASVQDVSGGRLQLGVGVGGRIGGPDAPDEWRAAEQPARGRAARLDRFLTLLPDALAGRPVPLGDTRAAFSPAVAAPDLWIGGGSDAALERVLRHGAGWLAAQLTPTDLQTRAAALRNRASEHGLPAPRVATMVYAAPNKPAEFAAEQLSRTYGIDHDHAATLAVGGSTEQLSYRLNAFVEAGADTLIVAPTGVEQTPALADHLAAARP